MKKMLVNSVIGSCLLLSAISRADGADGSKVWHYLPTWNVTLDLQSHSGDYTLYIDGVVIGPIKDLEDTYWQIQLNPGIHEVTMDGATNQYAGRLEAWLMQGQNTETHFISEAGTGCEYFPGGTGSTLEETQEGPSRYTSCQAISGVAVSFRFVVAPAPEN